MDESLRITSPFSRTRRLLDPDTHKKVFGWALETVGASRAGEGQDHGVDSTTLEANAAMKSIVRRDTGDNYMGYLKRVAEAEGVAAPDTAGVAAHGSEAQEEDQQRRLDESCRSGSGDHQAQGRSERRWHTRSNKRWIWRPERSLP